MPITLLDGILIGFTLVSAVLAMVRGFTREILAIASWVAAAAAAYYFYPAILPYVQPHISNEKIAMAAAAAIIFFIALIVVTVITMKIADFIIDSRIGALDRTLGFLYGAARGVLVVAVGLLFFTWLAGANMPVWVTGAKSLPLLTAIGTKLESMLPEDTEVILEKIVPGGGTDAEPTQPAPEATEPAPGAAPDAAEPPPDTANPPADDDDAPAEPAQ